MQQSRAGEPSIPVGPEEHALRAARVDIAHGHRPLFRICRQREDDGSYTVQVLDVPGMVLSVTSRKGVEPAARTRLALLLDVAETAFDLVVEPSGRSRARRGG